MYRLVLFAATGIGLFLIMVFVKHGEIGGTDQAQQTPADEVEAEYYFQDTINRHFDESGRFDYEFTAERIEHFVEEDYTLVESPAVSFYQEDGTPWLITAQHGRSSTANEKIELWQDVRVNRNSEIDPLQMETETLQLNTPKKIATTEDPVTMTYPKGRIDAVGMKAYIEKNRVELLSEVRVQHDPIDFN